MAWTPWPTQCCAPASRPKRGSALPPTTSPPLEVWPGSYAKSWHLTGQLGTVAMGRISQCLLDRRCWTEGGTVFEAAGSAQGLFVGTIYDWVPEPGRVVSWEASAASLEKARKAPISDVPLSAMQAAHLRGFSRYAARGLDYARLVIGSGDEPGRGDIRAMGYLIK